MEITMPFTGAAKKGITFAVRYATTESFLRASCQSPYRRLQYYHTRKRYLTKKSDSIQGTVYTALRKSIINLNLLPGKAISEKEISLKFNVSRTPVREAFIQLANEGLVEIFPQKETLVSKIDETRVNQEFFLRESLERAVLELFIERSAPGDFSGMEACLEKQKEAYDGKDYTGFLTWDNNFHKAIFDASGQDLSWNVMESMGGHYYRVRLLSTWLSGIPKSIVSQHKKLLASLKKKDSAKARSLLDEHLHQLPAEMRELQKEYPQYFATSSRENRPDIDFGGFPPGKS
jgi:DNA-binding GntR family transcriptional regulator